MNDEEIEAVEILKQFRDYYAREDIHRESFTSDKSYEKSLNEIRTLRKQFDTVLTLVTRLQKENEEIDKQIDLMLDKIDMTKPSPCTMTNEYSIGRVYMSKEEKKQYFEKLSKEKGE